MHWVRERLDYRIFAFHIRGYEHRALAPLEELSRDIRPCQYAARELSAISRLTRNGMHSHVDLDDLLLGGLKNEVREENIEEGLHLDH